MCLFKYFIKKSISSKVFPGSLKLLRSTTLQKKRIFHFPYSPNFQLNEQQRTKIPQLIKNSFLDNVEKSFSFSLKEIHQN
jgi:hypothetical protein